MRLKVLNFVGPAVLSGLLTRTSFAATTVNAGVVP